MVAAPAPHDRTGSPALGRKLRAGRPEPLDVETRLVALARAEAPLRRSLAAIAARLVARRAWERLGFVRLGDYARERAGLSARQLQDLAHVDACLARLPGIERAFTSGVLTWTKTRLLCRVATAEDEALWIATAQRTTARSLACEVRRLDEGSAASGSVATDEEGAVEEPREALCFAVSPPVRAKWSRARELAWRTAGERLPPWEVAERIAAEVLSAIPLDEEAVATLEESANGCAKEAPARDHATSGPASGCAGEEASGYPPLRSADGRAHEPPGGENPTPWRASPRAAPFLRTLVDGLDEADPFELDARLRRAVRLEQRLHAEMGPLLQELASRRLHRLYDCPSLDAFAREWLGMSPRKAQALLRLERACLLCPGLRDAYRTGRLSWAKAQVLAPLAFLEDTGPWRAAWVARAERVSVRRLEEDVDRAIVSRSYDPEAAAIEPPPDPQTGAREPHTVARAPDARTPLPTQRLTLHLPLDVARLFRAVLATARRRLERLTGAPASIEDAFEAMLDHALVSWEYPQSPHRKLPREYRVYARDGWRCTIPGCTSYRNLHDHHIVYRSRGGDDDLANRTTMCAAHHQRGVHAGFVRCRGSAPDRLRFELGVRAAKPPLAVYLSGDVVSADAAMGVAC
jgi:hypothetical protein